MKGQRRIAVVEDFFEIIKQIHDVDCLHAGSKKTYARVCIAKYGSLFDFCVSLTLKDSEFIFQFTKKCC